MAYNFPPEIGFVGLSGVGAAEFSVISKLVSVTGWTRLYVQGINTSRHQFRALLLREVCLLNTFDCHFSA